MAKGSIGGNSDTRTNNITDAVDSGEDRARELADLRAQLDLANVKKLNDYQQKLEKRNQKDRLKSALEIDDEVEQHKVELSRQNAEFVAQYEKMLESQKIQEALEARKKMEQELYQYQAANADSIAERYAAALKVTASNFGENLGENLGKAVGSLLGNIGSAVNKSIDQYLDIYSKYKSSIDARIQGSGTNYSSIEKLIRQNSMSSPYIKYTDVMEKLNTLVDAGIADNVAQRAFLMTISDKIATTFDAANSTLLQIIRLQNQDTTAARLGMEAELTKLFNHYFSDTSYLSDVFDAVESALVGVSSQLSAQSAVELDYQVQKWLGSLYSVGVQDSTVSKIAQGINYLGTGNITALSSDESLQNLFVMAANRVGLNYNQMLTRGISSSETNALMKSIIEYIQDISSTTNNVVKAQYAELFGLTMSDMVAFQNMSDDVVASLYQNGMTYINTLQELNSQLSQVSSRMHFSEMVDNVINNTLAGLGLGVADNIVTYASYKAFDLLKNITGGIYTPVLSAMGNWLDLKMSVEDIAKTAIIGVGAASSMMSAVNNLFSGASLNVDRWSLGTNKPSGYGGYTNVNQLSQTTSTTTYVSSGNSTGIQQSLYETQESTGESVTGSRYEEDSGDEMLTIMRFIYDYLKGGGEAADKVLKVEVSNFNDMPLPEPPSVPFNQTMLSY